MRRKNQLQAVSPKQRWQLFGIGIVVAVHWCFFYGSIKYSNISIALTCLSSAGLFTAFLEPIMTNKKIVGSEILLGMIGITGIYLIFHFDLRYQTGIILGIICTLCSCLFSILNKKQVAYTAPRTMMLYELVGGFIFITLIMPFYLHVFPAKYLLPTANDWLWLVLLSWVCTILAMDLSLQALQKISAFTQNLTINLEPVYGIVLAFAVYKENKDLSKWFFIGFALILLAVVLQMTKIVHQRKKAKLA